MEIRTTLIVGFLSVALLTSFLGSLTVVALNEPSLPAEQVAILLSILSLFSAAAIGILLGRSVSRPLDSLTATIRTISRGGTDASIDTAIIDRDDEIGELARAFDRTLASLKLAMQKTAPHLESKVRETEEDLKRLGVLLQETLDHLDTAIVILDDNAAPIYFNEQLLDLWGLDDETIASIRSKASAEDVLKASAEAAMEHVAHPDAFQKKVVKLAGNQENITDTVEMKDGRTIERDITPLQVGGEVAGQLLLFRERSAEEDADGDG